MTFVPPFDDYRIIEGQATVGVEILDELNSVDYLFLPVGGGGLDLALAAILKCIHPKQKLLLLNLKARHLCMKHSKQVSLLHLKVLTHLLMVLPLKRTGDLTFQFAKKY